MIKPIINIEEVLAGIKDNLESLKTVKFENMTEKERAKFRKDLEELKRMTLSLRQRSK